jgi:NTE family protein
MKRALVLGCGGVAGAAWTAATLAELERALGWDARDADVLIGTSAGALAVALLACGVGVARMVASQAGTLRDDCWDHERDWGSPLPPLPALDLTGPKLALRGLLGQVSPMVAITGLAPRGRADLTPLARLVERAERERTRTHTAAWIVAVDAETGQRVLLNREGAPTMSLARAVCASYAVPGWCPPVQEAGRTLIDGGVVSPASADLLIGTGVDEAVVLAPMTSRVLDAPRGFATHAERLLRRQMTRILDREVAALARSGVRVVRIEPGPEDLRAFGANMMDPGRRKRVFETALRTAPQAVQNALNAESSRAGA